VRPILITAKRLLSRHDQGQTLVEYGLIIGILAIAGFVMILAMGGGLDTLYAAIVAGVECAATQTCV
jgi:Flp pilus assembly pilin Flp